MENEKKIIELEAKIELLQERIEALEAQVNKRPLYIEGEEWAEIPDFPDYQASNKGRIKNSSGRVLYNRLSGKYLTVRLHKEGSEYTKKIHRLVLSAFTGHDRPDMQVNHIDGDRYNNELSNLEWCTREENLAHARAMGLLHEWDPRPIVCLETGEIFPSMKQCAESFGWSYGNARASIPLVCEGLKKTYCGYSFRYLDEDGESNEQDEEES